MGTKHARKKVPDRDSTRLLLHRRQRAAEQSEREPRRLARQHDSYVTPKGACS